METPAFPSNAAGTAALRSLAPWPHSGANHTRPEFNCVRILKKYRGISVRIAATAYCGGG